MFYVKDATDQVLTFTMIGVADGLPLTGLSITGKRTIDGGAQASVTGTISEVGGGQYKLAASAADMGGNNIGFLFTATGAIPVNRDVVTTTVNFRAIGGMVISDMRYILGTLLTQTNSIAAAFKQFFDVASPTGTMKAITNVVTATNLTNIPTGVALEATLDTIKNKAGSSGFDRTTDSLEALRERVDQVMVSTGTALGYAPDSATRVIGTDEGGTVSNLAAHDDSNFVTGENASTGLEVVVTRNTSVTTQNPAVLRVVGYYDGVAGHIINVNVYNYVTAAYETKGVMIDRASAFEYSFPLSLDNHNSSTGEMKVQFKHAVQTYGASHRLYLDFVGWEKVDSNSSLISDLASIKVKSDQMNFNLGNILAESVVTTAPQELLDLIEIIGTPGETIAADIELLKTKLLKYVQLMLRSDAAIATDNETELLEINADQASGAGDYSNQAESNEAIKTTLGEPTTGEGATIATDIQNYSADISTAISSARSEISQVSSDMANATTTKNNFKVLTAFLKPSETPLIQ